MPLSDYPVNRSKSFPKPLEFCLVDFSGELTEFTAVFVLFVFLCFHRFNQKYKRNFEQFPLEPLRN